MIKSSNEALLGAITLLFGEEKRKEKVCHCDACGAEDNCVLLTSWDIPVMWACAGCRGIESQGLKEEGLDT
jgi:hypothetical protein